MAHSFTGSPLKLFGQPKQYDKYNRLYNQAERHRQKLLTCEEIKKNQEV